ncbi:MAG TPA: DUF2207 domain-containing protein, partial [Acidimicrobiales bacterium]|nr:DUF2207 domain-containing protein [Acidimicrobiales bacterium]
MAKLAVVLIALVTLLGAPGSAHAQSGSERINRYDVVTTIEPDGDLLIVETIVYDFGGNQRRGIFRDIPTRLRYDNTHDRVYRLRDVAVSSPTAPAQVQREDGPGGTTRLRIGDPDRFITGPHEYRIAYRIEGGLNGFEGHVELYWNAIGADWAAPIADASVTVHAPATIRAVACFTGPQGSSLPCESSGHEGRTATFAQRVLAPYEALTFVVALPLGSVTSTEPILEERWSAARAFSATPATLGLAGGLLGLVIAGVGVLAWKVGRDRQAVGSAVDVAFAQRDDDHERVPLFGRDDHPVQVEPPDGLRPGQVGTLIDERANPLDVTATIIDLAVRGYLRIEEIPKSGWFSKADWRLVRLKKPDDALLKYERLLLNGLFQGRGDEVELSDLKEKFAKRLAKVQAALYEDALDRHWFRHSPQTTRAQWIGIGIAVAVVGVGLTVLAAATTTLGLVPIPIVIGGVLLIALSGRMPYRTAAGTGALVRTLGFKRFIDDSERDRARFAEQQHLFSEYLPYAVVFGATEKWAKAFAGLDGALPDQSSWYVGTHGFTYSA